MSTVPSPARPDETAEDPYRAPSTALHEAMIDAQIEAFAVGPDDIVLQQASCAFDASLSGRFCPFCSRS